MQDSQWAEGAATPGVVVSGDQLDLGAALRNHAMVQLRTVAETYFGCVEAVTCTFRRTGDGGFGCAIRMPGGHGRQFAGSAEHVAAPGAFTLALEHLVRQLRRRRPSDRPAGPTRDGVL